MTCPLYTILCSAVAYTCVNFYKVLKQHGHGHVRFVGLFTEISYHEIRNEITNCVIARDIYLHIFFKFAQPLITNPFLTLKGLFPHSLGKPFFFYFNFFFSCQNCRYVPKSLPQTLTRKLYIKIEKAPYTGLNFTCDIFTKYPPRMRVPLRGSVVRAFISAMPI